MSKARNLSLLSTVEVAATTDQTKSDIEGLGIDVTSSQMPSGSVVRTTQISNDAAPSHISTSSSTAAASGLIISTPATTGSNYNIITLSSDGYTYSNQSGRTWLYSNKNGAGYSQATGGIQSCGHHHNYSAHRRINATWVDNSSGLNTGTNLYQMYISTSTGTFYLAHRDMDYTLTVQEIQA